MTRTMLPDPRDRLHKMLGELRELIDTAEVIAGADVYRLPCGLIMTGPQYRELEVLAREISTELSTTDC